MMDIQEDRMVEGAAWQVVCYKEGDEDEIQGCLSTPQQAVEGSDSIPWSAYNAH